MVSQRKQLLGAITVLEKQVKKRQAESAIHQNHVEVSIARHHFVFLGTLVSAFLWGWDKGRGNPPRKGHKKQLFWFVVHTLRKSFLKIV